MKTPQTQQQTMEHTKTDEFLGEYKEQPRHRTSVVNIGDQVIMNSQYKVSNEHKGVIWKVIDGPRFMGGRRCVKLDGYKDWYPIDGLQVVG